ncbi:MAG: hypothetical protein QME68_04985 [Elusimicrobiota bacterium]|nr:hypothetical protein [Elusimicrobiota bacterium]
MSLKPKVSMFNVLTVICLALFTTYCLLSTDVYAAGTPANTQIDNGGDAGTPNVLDVNGDVIATWSGGLTKSSETCNTITIYVDTGCAIVWVSTPATNSQNLAPGSTAYYGYQVRNGGNATDNFSLEVTTVATNSANVAQWTMTIYKDELPYGQYNGETTIISNTGPLSAEATYYLLVAVYVPVGTVNGSSTTVRLTIKDNFGAGNNDHWPSATNDDTVTHDTLTSYAEALLQVVKSTNSVSGSERPYDIYEYVLVVKSTGVVDATNIVLRDRIPSNVSFYSDAYGSGYGIKRDQATIYTTAADDDAAEYDTVNRTVVIRIGTLAPGEAATIRYQVKVD